MPNNLPSLDALLDSFNRVYHGLDDLRHEYDLVVESQRMGVPLDTYRRLYKLRKEEPIPPYPKPQKWFHVPREWAKSIWHLPPKKKLSLSRKGVVSIIQNGAILTIAIALGQYFLEAPKRVKQSHYQAWQMINSATGQKTSGGRIEALQDLNKDGVSLQGLNASGANLVGIKLQNADLEEANLNKADLAGADLSNAALLSADFSYARLVGADLSNAYLPDADFSNAILGAADLSNADIRYAHFSHAMIGCTSNNRNCTNFKGAKGITPDQIKKATYWEKACYDPDFRIKLGLPPQNPKCWGEEPKK